MRKFLLYTVALLGLGYAALANGLLTIDFPPTAEDYSVALDCTVLENNDGRIMVSIPEYERRTANIQGWDDLNKYRKSVGVTDYTQNAPLLLEHGWPPTKLPTTPATDRMHVSKVTQTGVELSGHWNSQTGRGYIDRTSGEGRISWTWDNDGHEPDGKLLFRKGQVVWDYLFACKPSKPVLF